MVKSIFDRPPGKVRFEEGGLSENLSRARALEESTPLKLTDQNCMSASNKKAVKTSKILEEIINRFPTADG